MPTNNCVVCGNKFSARRDAKSCSQRCRKRLQRLSNEPAAKDRKVSLSSILGESDGRIAPFSPAHSHPPANAVNSASIIPDENFHRTQRSHIGALNAHSEPALKEAAPSYGRQQVQAPIAQGSPPQSLPSQPLPPQPPQPSPPPQNTLQPTTPPTQKKLNDLLTPQNTQPPKQNTEKRHPVLLATTVFLLFFALWTAFAAIQRAQYEPGISFWQRWVNTLTLGPYVVAPPLDDKGQLVGPAGPAGEKGEPGNDGAAGCQGGTCVDLQDATPGIAQTGHLNISGIGRFGDVIATTLQGNGADVTDINADNVTTGTLTVPRGGTGTTSFATNGVLFGNGTFALQATSTPTGGQVLLGNAGGVPTFTTLSDDIHVDSSGSVTIQPNAVALTTDTTGDYVATLTGGAGLTGSGTGEGSTPTLAIGQGSGITVNTNDIELGPLTTDWLQSGAFDIVLDHADSELRILESAGGTFYGTLDVGDLSADRTYTLPDNDGTLCTTAGNCAGTGGGVTTSGGTTNRLAKFTSAQNIEDSSISDDGATVTLNGSNMIVQGGSATVGTTSQAGSLLLHDGSSNTGTLLTAALGSDRTYTFPDVSGEVSLLGQTISNAELVNDSVTYTSGSGLTGGGTVALGGSATFNIGAGACITVNADDVAVIANCVDAATLDSLNSAQFLRSDTSDNYTNGTLTFDAGTLLDINGGLAIADTDIVLDGASTNFTATGDLSFNTDDLFIEKATGEVGIGTNNPQDTLDVNGIIRMATLGTADTSTFVCRNSSNQLSSCSTTGTGATFIQGGNSFGAIAVLGTNDAFDLQFETNGSTKMTIDTNGNVGIGDISPDAQLDIDMASASTVGFQIQGIVGQTSNYLNVLNSSGGNVLSVQDDGIIQAGSGPNKFVYDPNLDSFLIDTDDTVTGYALQVGSGAGIASIGVISTNRSATITISSDDGTNEFPEIVFQRGDTNPTITLRSDIPAANRTITLPDETGTICLQSSANCGFATGTSAAFVQGGNSFGATAVLGTNDANSLTFETNNATQATIAVGGATTFQNSADSTAAFQIQNSTGTSNLFVADTTNNKVGIGTDSPTSTFHVDSPDNTFITVESNNIDVAHLGDIGGADDGALQLYNSAGNENVRIRGCNCFHFINEGTLGVGSTVPTLVVADDTYTSIGSGRMVLNQGGTPSPLDINQTFNDSLSRAMIRFYRRESQVGSIVSSTTGTAYNETSDARLKENIANTDTGLSTLLQIPVRDFNFTHEPDQRIHGFIAQELNDLYGYAVTPGGDDPNEDPWQVDYGRLTPLIVKSIQDLSQKVDNLQVEGNFTNLNVGELATVKNLEVTETITVPELIATDKVKTADLVVNGHIFVGKDAGGEVTIAAGKSKNTYTFGSSYAKLPLVTITPHQDPKDRYWVTRTKSSFTIHLSEPASSNITFSYHALEPR